MYRTGYSSRRSFTAGSARLTRYSLPSTVSWPTALRSWCSCPAIPVLASLRWCTSCTRCSSRRVVSSRPASSTSTSGISRTPPWPKPSRALCARSWARGEAELGRWRDALSEALGANGQLIVNLVPALELVIGRQPPIPDLPTQDAQNRFQMVFRRFLGVFARKEHPLALFLDDLQWLDTATLDLLEHLVTHPDVRHLMLVGAYRDNEVSPSNPLLRT